MIPTGFLHHFPEAMGISLILPKAVGPSRHGERNSQVMWSQIAGGQPTCAWGCCNHTSSDSNLILISETFPCFSNYFNSAEWMLACSPNWVLEFASMKKWKLRSRIQKQGVTIAKTKLISVACNLSWGQTFFFPYCFVYHEYPAPRHSTFAEA